MFIYPSTNLMFMSQTKILMALALIGGLFLVIGVQTSVSAQMANDTSAAMGAAAKRHAEMLFRPVSVARRHLEIYSEIDAEFGEGIQRRRAS